MAKLGLNLSEVKINTGSQSGFSIVPSGTYKVVVGSAEVGSTKNGSSLIIGYAIAEGEHEGKLIKDFLNIENPSVEAVRISMERLATITWATNAPTKKGVLEDTDDLVGKEVFEIVADQVVDGEYTNMKIKAVICTRDLEEAKEVKEVKTTTKKAQPWNKK